jgi:hypothetical protein
VTKPPGFLERYELCPWPGAFFVGSGGAGRRQCGGACSCVGEAIGRGTKCAGGESSPLGKCVFVSAFLAFFDYVAADRHEVEEYLHGLGEGALGVEMAPLLGVPVGSFGLGRCVPGFWPCEG